MVARPPLLAFLGLERSSELDLDKLMESGLPLDVILVLTEHGITSTEISNLVISPRTLRHRKLHKEKLSKEETGHVIRIGRIVSEAAAVFGSRDKALHWLRMPNDGFDNRVPLEMLSTESGERVVESMLWQIDEGIYT